MRFDNPWCDRPIEVIPKEFALGWNIPESSVYEAIAKLKQLGILQIKSGKLVVKWAAYSQQGSFSGNLEKILRSQKIFRDPRKNSETSENRGLESLSDGNYNFPQTIQTLQTNQTRGGEKTFSEKPEVNDQSQDEGNQQEPEVKQGEESQEKNSLETIASVVARIPRAVAQKTTKVIQAPQIPQDLIDKLEELEIPLDGRVREAIASHHLSQAYGAVAHIENTWESINNPHGVFLFQLPRQPVEVMGTRGRLRTARDFDFTLTDIKRMFRERTQVPIPYRVGDVCEIVVKDNPELRGLGGCWCIVTEVREFSCLVHPSKSPHLSKSLLKGETTSSPFRGVGGWGDEWTPP